MRHLLTAFFAAAAVIAVPVAADAAPCKDAKGKFVRCPSAAAPAALAKKEARLAKKESRVAKKETAVVKKETAVTKRCRNAKGQFAKCGTPGAKPG